MIGKITAAVIAAIVLASAGAVSAQTNSRSTRIHSQWQSTQAPYGNIWTGSGFPAGKFDQRNPYAGTVFDGVAPYLIRPRANAYK